ncbi:MAG: glycosyltransferase family 4 protein [Thermoleophilia bacterium]
MKILYALPVVPWPPSSGLKVRSFYLARELARRHDVHFFCLSTSQVSADQAKAIDEAGPKLITVEKHPMSHPAKVMSYLRRLARGVPLSFMLSWEDPIFHRIERLASDEGFDVAVAEHLFMARYISTLTCPKVLVEENVEGQLARALAARAKLPLRWARKASAVWTGHYEKKMLGMMQEIVAVSTADAGTLSRMIPGMMPVVVENGVSCEEYRELASGERASARSLLFIGLMSYEPNVDAVMWFAAEILPRLLKKFPDVVINVAGGEPSGEVTGLDNGLNLRVLGFVDDLKPLYRESAVLVVPLRAGGGSRLKILEAFAAGTPVVSTSIGAEGLEAEDGVHLLVADSPADFMAAVVRLLEDGQLYEKMSRNARLLAEEKYDWPVLAKKFEAALQQASKLK